MSSAEAILVTPRTPRDRRPARRSRLALIVRLLAIGCILLSPFAPAHEQAVEARSVVYVIDRSGSVPDDGAAEAFLADVQLARDAARAAGQPSVDVQLVEFDASVRLAVPIAGALGLSDAGPSGSPMDPPAALPAPSPQPALGSDLAGALRLAAAALPPHGQRRIVLLSDGRPTTEGAQEAAREARAAGVVLDAVPLGQGAFSGSRVALHIERSALHEGEPVQASASLVGEPFASTTLSWSRDGTFLRSESVSLDAQGRAQRLLHDPDPGSGAHVYEASLPGLMAPSRAAAIVHGRPKVLVLTLGRGRVALLEAALADAELELEIAPLGELELDDSRLSSADLVVLADIPLEREGEVTLLEGLDVAGQEALVEFVRERGGGLLVSGGAFGFGPNYANTPLARMLPVRVEDQGEIEDPPVALAIMLDRSGSMGAQVGAYTKMQLANEAALAAASNLRPIDRVGIAAVDVATTWHQPLDSVSALGTRQHLVRAIRAGGGGIYVYTSLVDAYEALRAAPEPIRHVILFSDTADSEEQYQGCPFMPCRRTLPWAVDLAVSARLLGITTSVVGIGRARDSDTEFLQQLATGGGGRFYLTGDGADLRRIFVSETRAIARTNLRNETLALMPGGPSEMREGLDLSAMPPIQGFVQTETRPTADTSIVVAEDGRPLLASWRYGLGKVVALTTDLSGGWTEAWAGSASAAQLLRQITRFASRRRAAEQGDMRVALMGGVIRVELDLPERRLVGEAGAEPPTLELLAISRDGQMHPLEASLERIAPDRFAAQLRVGHEPVAVIARARGSAGEMLGEGLGEQRAAGELDALGPDTLALGNLASLGGGLYAPEAALTLRPTPTSAPRPLPTWPWLLLLAVLLFSSDLWLRRLSRPSSFAAAELPSPRIERSGGSAPPSGLDPVVRVGSA
ncbi:MAG: VWA domain-containing protein [Myxococcales bacterium]|nr:VWA domain-containing protein [Myxococcales bacterium]